MTGRRGWTIAFPDVVAQFSAMGVDQDQRRRDIAAITIDLIAREGLAAATMRRIAAEAGSSTTAITHYFDDKRDLIVMAFQILSAEGEVRFEEVLAKDPSDAIGALLTMVPWCPANVRRWKAYLAFWDEAARDPELAALLAQSTNEGSALIHRLVGTRVTAGADIERIGRLLNAIIQGLALQMLVDERSWSQDKIRDLLEQGLNFAILQG